MTVILPAAVLAALAVDAATHELLTDVRLAMKRADLSLDYVARCCLVPPEKLSHQLAGRLPFTYCWRILANAEIRESDFWPELLALRAERFDRALVSSELGVLVARVTALVDAVKKPMARMDLAVEQKVKVG